MDVKKVAHELSGPLAKVRALQADNDSSNPPGKFHNNVFFSLQFLFELYYVVITNLLTNFFLAELMHKRM